VAAALIRRPETRDHVIDVLATGTAQKTSRGDVLPLWREGASLRLQPYCIELLLQHLAVSDDPVEQSESSSAHATVRLFCSSDSGTPLDETISTQVQQYPLFARLLVFSSLGRVNVMIQQGYVELLGLFVRHSSDDDVQTSELLRSCLVDTVNAWLSCHDDRELRYAPDLYQVSLTPLTHMRVPFEQS
jgi:hypothetical protein